MAHAHGTLLTDVARTLQTAVGVVLVVLLSAHALPSVVPRAVDHLLHVQYAIFNPLYSDLQ